jgi:hypothetical protein
LPRCALVEQPDRSICTYRCEVADSIPAVPLPASVQFERIRAQGDQDQVLYSWRDTVAFSGQELQSFMAPSDRIVTLELASSAAWHDRAGDTLDEVRVISPGGSASSVDLISRGQRELPSWMSVSTPNITCSSRLRVVILGASSYDEQSFAVAGGRLVLDDPHSFRSHWHPRFMMGIGVLGVRSEPKSGLYVPTRSTPYVTLGGLAERYLDRWPAALELRALFDISKTTFGICKTVESCDEDSKLGRVGYVRANFGVSFLWWASRRLHVGAGLALGVGFPISHDDFRAVADSRWSFVTELVDVQARLGRNAWLDVAVGVRWLEEHNFCKDSSCASGPYDEVRHNSPFVATRIRL